MSLGCSACRLSGVDVDRSFDLPLDASAQGGPSQLASDWMIGRVHKDRAMLCVTLSV